MIKTKVLIIHGKISGCNGKYFYHFHAGHAIYNIFLSHRTMRRKGMVGFTEISHMKILNLNLSPNSKKLEENGSGSDEGKGWREGKRLEHGRKGRDCIWATRCLRAIQKMGNDTMAVISATSSCELLVIAFNLGINVLFIPHCGTRKPCSFERKGQN